MPRTSPFWWPFARTSSLIDTRPTLLVLTHSTKMHGTTPASTRDSSALEGPRQRTLIDALQAAEQLSKGRVAARPSPPDSVVPAKPDRDLVESCGVVCHPPTPATLTSISAALRARQRAAWSAVARGDRSALWACTP